MKPKMQLSPKVAPAIKLKTILIYSAVGIAATTIIVGFLIFFFNVGNFYDASAATTIYSTAQTGSWSTNNTWTNNQRPATTNLQDVDITIGSTHSVTSTAFDSKNKVTLRIQANAVLTINGNFDVDNDFTLHNSGTLIINGSFTAKNGANVTINGSGRMEVADDATFNNNAIATVNGTLQVGGSITFDNNNTFKGSGAIAVGETGCEFFTGTGTCTSSATSNLLPVELLDFTGADNGNGTIKLAWKTASEINNDYFTIQRSKNGVDYEDIGTVKGNGTTKEVSYFDFIDLKAITGRAYYRLSQTDYDKTTEVFKPILVALESKATVNFSAYPNPLTGQVLTIEFSDPKPGMITIINSAGNTITSKVVEQDQNSMEIEFTSDLSPGIYYINYKAGNTTQNLKLIKK